VLPRLTAAASGLFMVGMWVTRLQPAPRVDGKFLTALLPVAFFHTVGHVSACVSFSQVSCGAVVVQHVDIREAEVPASGVTAENSSECGVFAMSK
jgi:solute carrier family 35 protein E1